MKWILKQLVSIDLATLQPASEPLVQTSIQALESAIQTVLGTSNRETKQPTKRTVLRRSEGQIITEQSISE